MKLAALVLAFVLSAWTLVPPGAEAQSGPATLAYEGTENVASVFGRLDFTCILRTWRITGVMACPAFPHGVNVCVITENAYPVGIVEVVRRPYTSHLQEVMGFLVGLQGLDLFGETSSHTANHQEGRGLLYTESRAYHYGPPLQGLTAAFAIPYGWTAGISYISELDGYSWRTGFADYLMNPELLVKKMGLPACSVIPRTGDCAWRWGSWVPHTGFLTHPSEVMGAHLLALRAGRVAARPGLRTVIQPYLYEPRTGHFVQMIRPTTKACFSIGSSAPPIVKMMEGGSLSRAGAYLFIHFGIFRECDGCFPALLVEPRPPTF